MYSMPQKNHDEAARMIKNHVRPGSVLFSDMHSMYTNMHSSKSQLSRYGIYHCWTNHSETMVHYKLKFIHSLNIEREWGHLKSKWPGIGIARTE